MSDAEKKTYLPPEEYGSLVRADNGQPLTDLFPEGILVSFRGDEITDFQDGSGIARHTQVATLTPFDEHLRREVEKFTEWRAGKDYHASPLKGLKGTE